MIKGTTRKRTFRAIYRLLDQVSPVPFDCGRICGAACCHADGLPEMGMFLLPGEDKIHQKTDDWLSWEMLDTDLYDFPPSWQGKVCFVNCQGPEHCKRALRPIQCRTFPLKPVFLKADETPPGLVFRGKEGLALIYSDDELPYACPLITSQARLDPAFIQATYTVRKHLIRDPLIYDYIKEEGTASPD